MCGAWHSFSCGSWHATSESDKTVQPFVAGNLHMEVEYAVIGKGSHNPSQLGAGCEDVREELVLRLLGLLGLDLTSADCSNAFASTQQRSLDDSSSAALSPLLPAWHPHGIPLQAPSTSSSADSPSDSAPASLPTGQSAWILPPPTFAHTPEPLEQRQRSAAEEGAAAQHSMQLLPVWYLASEERRLFVLRLLSLGPFQDSCYFAEALLDVMAASALSAVGVPLHASLPGAF